MNNYPALGLDHVSVSVGGTAILHDVTFHAQPGRIHALVGRNGASKSTAFKTMLGLLRPTSGTASIFGAPPGRDTLRNVGSSVNGPALYGHLSTQENLRVHTLLLGLPKSEGDRVAQIVGLAGTGRKKARTFSTGMKARLALAIAMLGNPEILLLDEPQNGLDLQGIVELRGLLRQWADQGGTVILSSHQLSEITRIADDLTVLSGGAVVWTGSAEEFRGDAADIEARFLDLTGDAA